MERQDRGEAGIRRGRLLGRQARGRQEYGEAGSRGGRIMERQALGEQALTGRQAHREANPHSFKETEDEIAL